MADSAISFVVGRLGQLLTDEADLLVGVEDEVEWMRNQLEWMKAFLQDAYAKRRSGDQRAKLWERAVRDATYHAEDIIESYLFQIIRRREQPLRSRWILKPVERWTRELKPRHKLGSEIKELKAKINEIKENRINYGLVDLGQSAPSSPTNSALALQRQRRTFSQHSDNVVVGFHHHKQEILRELLNTRITRRCVKSIVGMGGLGKTTLAEMVFKSNEIKTSFDTLAWVTVSQHYTLLPLLTIIGKQITGAESQGLDESALREKIYQFLLDKRYFITMDDIWTEEDWRLLEGVFPHNENGSRVLVTTRSEPVARSVDPGTNPYYLSHLGEKESQQLFLTTAIPSDHGAEQKICPEVIEDVAKSLVERCSGLPLALVVLGGLMYTKSPTTMAWKKVADQMEWASIHGGKRILKMLALSYNDLPDNLQRSCFQYLAIFPEDMIIEASQVIELWMAEGFITPPRNHTMEDTAESYLNEFALRSMIQVVERGFDGSIIFFRVHDLFRELCLKEGSEGGLLDVCGTSTNIDRIADEKPIRLVLQNMEQFCLPPDLRSLSVFGGSVESWEPIVGSKKLRVLNVNDSSSNNLCLKGNFCLRYFRSANDRSDLPSIKDLCNLQTLDFTDSITSQLPEELDNIHTLRHIYGNGGCLLPPNIDRLKSLRTLYRFSARGGWMEQSLAKLTELRKLSLTGFKTSQEKVLANALRELQHLSCLELSTRRDGSFSAEFIRTLSNNDCLFDLKLAGKMRGGKLPHSSEFPRYLTVLQLDRTELEEDPMTTLGQLPNLASLALGEDSYVGSEMVCNSGGFLRLEALVLNNLDKLTSWSVGEGAMPKLTCITIVRCWYLNGLPMGLQNLIPQESEGVVTALSDIRSLTFGRRIEKGHEKDLWKLEMCVTNNVWIDMWGILYG